MSSYKTGIVIAVVSLAGCWPGWESIADPPADKTAVFLEYNHTHDTPGDEDGGGKTPVDVPLTWMGTRVGEGVPTSDTFTQNTTYHGIATDPWSAETLVTNLTPGHWNLSVNVNGLLYTCPSAFHLTTGVNHRVVFQIDKDSGLFAGCTGN